jgi:hypothetical protein
MTMLGNLLNDLRSARGDTEECQTRTGLASAKPQAPTSSIRGEQIHGLIQQLFFHRTSSPVRRVGLVSIEPCLQTAALCFDIAKALTHEGTYEVGLIDAGVGETPLPTELQLPSPAEAIAPWSVCPRLWLVPRESWCPADSFRPATDHLERLREIASEFDFTIVRYPAISWLTARLARICDGVVLVLMANRTRRLVAAQARVRLSQSCIPLLGTVLAERSFPVPDSLYRSL